MWNASPGLAWPSTREISPGYPASHGWVRLPHEFGNKLYSVTHNGTQMIVTNDPAKADRTIGPSLLFAASPLVPFFSDGASLTNAAAHAPVGDSSEVGGIVASGS